MKEGSRASRIVAFLSTNRGVDYTLRQINDAVEPTCSITNISGCVSTLVRQGAVARVGSGVRNVKYTIKPDSDEPTSANEIASTSNPKKAPLRQQRANFPAAPGTTSQAHCPKRRTSAQIAHDIAEFERRGGRIQKLGITKVFHHPANESPEE